MELFSKTQFRDFEFVESGRINAFFLPKERRFAKDDAQ